MLGARLSLKPENYPLLTWDKTHLRNGSAGLPSATQTQCVHPQKSLKSSTFTCLLNVIEQKFLKILASLLPRILYGARSYRCTFVDAFASYVRADAQPLKKGHPVQLRFKLMPTSFKFLKGQVLHRVHHDSKLSKSASQVL